MKTTDCRWTATINYAVFSEHTAHAQTVPQSLYEQLAVTRPPHSRKFTTAAPTFMYECVEVQIPAVAKGPWCTSDPLAFWGEVPVW